MTAKKLKERKVKPGKTNFVYQTWHSGKTSRHNKHISNDWSQDQIIPKERDKGYYWRRAKLIDE